MIICEYKKYKKQGNKYFKEANMAELTVKGVATKEVVCDLVQYSFSFDKDGK